MFNGFDVNAPPEPAAPDFFETFNADEFRTLVERDDGILEDIERERDYRNFGTFQLSNYSDSAIQNLSHDRLREDFEMARERYVMERATERARVRERENAARKVQRNWRTVQLNNKHPEKKQSVRDFMTGLRDHFQRINRDYRNNVHNHDKNTDFAWVYQPYDDEFRDDGGRGEHVAYNRDTGRETGYRVNNYDLIGEAIKQGEDAIAKRKEARVERRFIRDVDRQLQAEEDRNRKLREQYPDVPVQLGSAWDDEWEMVPARRGPSREQIQAEKSQGMAEAAIERRNAEEERGQKFDKALRRAWGDYQRGPPKRRIRNTPNTEPDDESDDPPIRLKARKRKLDVTKLSAEDRRRLRRTPPALSFK